MLISLVYASVASNKNMSTDALRAILSQARENNKRDNITGLLLFRGGFFMQALEGEEEVVEALFEKIVKDKRHHNVLLVHKGKIAKRSFSDWSMGFRVIGDETLKSIEGFSDFLEKPMTIDYFKEHPSHAITLLGNFTH